MKQFPFLICPNALPKADYSTFIQTVSRCAIKNISLRAKWLSSGAAEKNPLPVHAVCLSGNFADRELQKTLLDTMEDAKKFSIPLVNIACKRDLSAAEQEISIDFFRDAAACARENSRRFTLETYGVISRTAEECLRVLERVGDENFQICYDTANVWRFAPELKHSGDLTNDFRKLAGFIGFMHLKDFSPATKKIMAPGKGEVDFPAIFSLLDEWQYDGFIGLDLETARAGEINTAAAYEEELRISIEYLSSLGVVRS